MAPLAPDTVQRLASRLQRIYGDDSGDCLERLCRLAERYGEALAQRPAHLWDQRDVVLITYGDQVRSTEYAPLHTLHQFLTSAELDREINTVHILPFSPYSSDDGFSVIDYRAVAPQMGDWPDVDRLGSRFNLMFDLVLNHCSQESDWFQDYLNGAEPYTNYFIEADPTVDLSAVTRPRSLPLLTPFETTRGQRHLWTTFSADQVDLNYANPDVLVEFADILLSYIQQGARIIRQDAVAYLWKEIGTSCIHLPQTHEVVKLLRDLCDAVAPGVLILTETNVPHDENISYFGDGDEAHMVYQFSLPPLLLDAFLNRDNGPLMGWLADFKPAAPGTTFFNFTASHDGVGVRPLEGIIAPERLEGLVQAIRQRGGFVSTKSNPDGSDTPYELNISYVDALGDPQGMDRALHARRFLASQSVMLALRGMPAVYFHSLVGTQNCLRGVQESGQPRRINRRKFQLNELRQVLAQEDSLQACIFQGYRKLLATRIAQPAFHPDGAQHVLPVDVPWLVGFSRTSPDQQQRVLVLVNLSEQTRQVDLKSLSDWRFSRDLLTNGAVEKDTALALAPYQAAWLEAAD